MDRLIAVCKYGFRMQGHKSPGLCVCRPRVPPPFTVHAKSCITLNTLVGLHGTSVCLFVSTSVCAIRLSVPSFHPSIN